jgi:hypothetical protein
MNHLSSTLFCGGGLGEKFQVFNTSPNRDSQLMGVDDGHEVNALALPSDRLDE